MVWLVVGLALTAEPPEQHKFEVGKVQADLQVLSV